MLYKRIIPCLLVQNSGLVKTVKFKNANYIGDPINAVKIFNDKEVDELVFLDIESSKKNTPINFNFLKKIAEECFMPLCYGGGIKSIDDIKKLFTIGFEKVSINSNAFYNPSLISEAAKIFGSQSIVVSVDVKKNLWGKYSVYIDGGKTNTKVNPIEYIKKMELLGAGEIFLNYINNDGKMEGYNLELINEVSNNVNIPVIACGGAGEMEDFVQAINNGASAVAAGSYFVYYGINKAVLINYPDRDEIKKYFKGVI